MPIHEILRKKRRELGYTQEQVASWLGVTAPAVNKWEKGSSLPDVSLLAPLARLLETDLNTLLGFREELTQQEMAQISAQLIQTAGQEGTDAAFAAAEDVLHRYPRCAALACSLALALDSVLLFSALPPDAKAPYREQVLALYEEAAGGDDPAVRDHALYMLVSDALQKEQYDRAETLLARLPEPNAMDKRKFQADLLLKKGQPAEAAVILERSLMQRLTDIMNILNSLAAVAHREDNPNKAVRLGQIWRETAKLYELWDYSAGVVSLEEALLRQDPDDTLALLDEMLQAVRTPWNVKATQIFEHMGQANGRDKPETTPPASTASASSGSAAPESDMTSQLLPMLLTDLKNNPQFAFLRGDERFERLMRKYL